MQNKSPLFVVVDLIIRKFIVYKVNCILMVVVGNTSVDLILSCVYSCMLI